MGVFLCNFQMYVYFGSCWSKNRNNEYVHFSTCFRSEVTLQVGMVWIWAYHTIPLFGATQGVIKANVPGIGLGGLGLGGSGEIDGTDAVHSSNEKSWRIH